MATGGTAWPPPRAVRAVTAWDRDAAALAAGRAQAAARGLDVDWQQVDLEADWPAVAAF